MKKILLTVAMLLSAAGMQALSIAPKPQHQSQYGVVSKAYPASVNVAPVIQIPDSTKQPFINYNDPKYSNLQPAAISLNGGPARPMQYGSLGK